MCGIVGSVGVATTTNSWIDGATKLLIHRGPDSCNTFSDKDLFFGSSRLAIIDKKGGNQPFKSTDDRYTIVFNGQIYNFITLKKMLVEMGSKFRSESDTEVLLNGYIKFGDKIVNYLEGMFAFAIWDRLDETLFIARDRFGEKPLCYSQTIEGGLIFASEVKVLLSHPSISRNPDRDSIQLMLNFGTIPTPRSAYLGINKLPPAHYLIWKKNKFKLTRYWEPNLEVESDFSEGELLKKLDELMLDSVKARMFSDRGVGAWLSGGVDSSLVTYYMSQIQDNPVETFSVRFENRAYDESDHSRKISDTFNTSHNELIIGSGVVNYLHEITGVLDEPFADSSFIATYLLSEYTAKNRVVVLGGDGGDESFGGYERYRLIKLLDSRVLANPLATYLIKYLSIFPFTSVLPSKLGQLISVMGNGQNTEIIYENFMTWIPKKSIDELLVDKSNPDLHSWFKNSFTTMRQSKRSKEFNFNLWDIMNYLPSDLLPKVDLASMAFGLEVRSPFLDTKLFSFGLALPDSMRVGKSNTKYLLKKLALQKLPHSVVNRPKRGFGVPREEWLRGELRQDLQFTLSKANVNLREIIDIDIAKSRLSAFNAGEKIDSEIWTLYMLGKWANHWL